jgi:ATP-dependent DNA ligase
LVFHILLRTRRTPSGFIEPWLPSPANHPPSGPGWIHEITHDGFRLMARRGAADVRLLSRNGHDCRRGRSSETLSPAHAGLF